MKKIKCEYCTRPNSADEFECASCGAPLPLVEEQLRVKRFSGVTTSTTAVPDAFATQYSNGVWMLPPDGEFILQRRG